MVSTSCYIDRAQKTSLSHCFCIINASYIAIGFAYANGGAIGRCGHSKQKHNKKKKTEALHGPQKSKSVVAVNRQNAARSDAPSCGVKWATACNVII